MDDQSSQSRDENNTDNQNEVITDDKAMLLSVKKRAAGALLPVVDSLDGPPGRKFELFMNAARSSNDPTLLNKALDAAELIDDKDEKANAILDVLNEANFNLKD